MKECCKTYLSEQFDGDEETMGEIYEEYVRSVGEKLSEMRTALASSDWLAFDRGAHAMKGNALSAGDTEMAETAISARKSAALNDAAACSAAIDKMAGLQGSL